MPVIFISRGTMSGVHLLVDYLHSQTGIRCISREDLEKDVNKHGEIAVRVLEKLANAHSAYDQFIGPYIENSEITKIIKIAQTVSDTANVQYNPGYASRFDNNRYFRTRKMDMDKDYNPTSSNFQEGKRKWMKTNITNRSHRL